MSGVSQHYTWADYVRSLGTQSEVARRSGVGQGTVSRWVDGRTVPDAKNVIAVARAFGENPITALVAADYLEQADAEHAGGVPARLALGAYSDHELATEMLRRVSAGDSPELTQPLDADHPAVQEVAGNVTPLRRADVSSSSEDELRARPHAANRDDSAGEQEPESP